MAESKRGQIPKHLQVSIPDSTRARSKKQETKIAQRLNGRTTINSGATFGENDVITDYAEVEAKTTRKNSFSFKVADWQKMVDKCAVNKIPIFEIEFEGNDLNLAVLNVDDLRMLIEMANKS